MKIQRPLSGLLALGALLAAAAPGAAQQEVDARWLPWLGCWETLGAPAPGEEDGMVCFAPADGAVERLRVVDGAVESRTLRAADGRMREETAEGCTVGESMVFSHDSRRIYREGFQRCEGGEEHRSTGLVAMLSPASFIDVEVVEVDDREDAWTQVYRRVPDERVAEAGYADLTADRGRAVAMARRVAAVAPSVEDVIDASQQVHPAAVRAWLAGRADPFDLDADALLRLADAGVDPEVIDVMVAVSYPERFAVGLESEARPRPDAYTAEGPYRRRPPYYDPWYDPFYRYGSRYGRYGYGGYGLYGFGGYGYGGYYGGPTIVVVDRRGGDGGEDRIRAVRGRGYTRAGTSTPAPTFDRSSPPPSGTSAGSTGSTGSGSSTGRKAKRRGGRDGGGL